MALFIRYQTKQGKTYTQLMDARRVDGKKKNIYMTNLGIVLDKDRRVFKSKERDIFVYAGRRLWRCSGGG